MRYDNSLGKLTGILRHRLIGERFKGMPGIVKDIFPAEEGLSNDALNDQYGTFEEDPEGYIESLGNSGELVFRVVTDIGYFEIPDEIIMQLGGTDQNKLDDKTFRVKANGIEHEGSAELMVDYPKLVFGIHAGNATAYVFYEFSLDKYAVADNFDLPVSENSFKYSTWDEAVGAIEKEGLVGDSK